MKKLRLLSGVSVTVLSCTLTSVVVQAGPVRSVVYKMVRGIQVSPYDLNKRSSSSRRRSPSPLSISQDDGQLPTSSSSVATLRSTVSVVHGGAKEKRNKIIKDLQAGESIYLPTQNEEGRILHNAPQRPHLIVDISRNPKYGSSDLQIIDMSRLGGKEHKVYNPRYSDEYHVITQSGPEFGGYNTSFLKLRTLRTITFSDLERRSVLKRKVSDHELEIIRMKLGFIEKR